jgi:hypothetical protein
MLVRVFRSLDALVGGDLAKAQSWMSDENVHLCGGPRTLIKRIDGIVRVAEYLKTMRAKLQMSDIWTSCDGPRRVEHRVFEAWRIAEAHHVVANRKLVDSNAKQEVLEALLDEAEPALPMDPALRVLHYLLLRRSATRHFVTDRISAASTRVASGSPRRCGTPP